MRRLWYVVDHADNDRILRGPYSYEETADAVRTEMERHATDKQNELWNLWIMPGPIAELRAISAMAAKPRKRKVATDAKK